MTRLVSVPVGATAPATDLVLTVVDACRGIRSVGTGYPRSIMKAGPVETWAAPVGNVVGKAPVAWPVSW
jgi:hypothetical protein